MYVIQTSADSINFPFRAIFKEVAQFGQKFEKELRNLHAVVV